MDDLEACRATHVLVNDKTTKQYMKGIIQMTVHPIQQALLSFTSSIKRIQTTNQKLQTLNQPTNDIEEIKETMRNKRVPEDMINAMRWKYRRIHQIERLGEKINSQKPLLRALYPDYPLDQLFDALDDYQSDTMNQKAHKSLMEIIKSMRELSKSETRQTLAERYQKQNDVL